MKTCKTCGVDKVQSEFHVALTTASKTFYRLSCKKCVQPQKRAQKQNRLNAYHEMKKMMKCEKCGNDDHRVLEFHHRNPKEKEYSVAERAASFSLDRLKKEIEKCICLCANCHRILHFEEKQPVA